MFLVSWLLLASLLVRLLVTTMLELACAVTFLLNIQEV